ETNRKRARKGMSGNAVACSRVRALRKAFSAAAIALEISSRNARVVALTKRWERRRGPGPDPGPAGRGCGRRAWRRERDAGALQKQGSRPAGDAQRPRSGLTGRRHARPRAAGRRGTGPVEDRRRGAQGHRRHAGGDHAGTGEAVAGTVPLPFATGECVNVDDAKTLRISCQQKSLLKSSPPPFLVSRNRSGASTRRLANSGPCSPVAPQNPPPRRGPRNANAGR